MSFLGTGLFVTKFSKKVFFIKFWLKSKQKQNLVDPNMVPGIVPSASVVRRASLKIQPEAAPFLRQEPAILFLEC
jgi:hypothetical protein